jgi:hypothetical protein
LATRKSQEFPSFFLGLFLLLASVACAAAQNTPAVPENKTGDSVSRLNKGLFKHILEDQRNIWLSPLQVKQKDAEWLLPFAGITTGLILTDRITQPEMSRNHVNTANSLSNYGLAAYGGGIAAFFIMGGRNG